MVILHVKFKNKNLYVKLYVKIKYYIIKHHNENVRVKRVHPRRGAKVFMCEDVYVFLCDCAPVPKIRNPVYLQF